MDFDGAVKEYLLDCQAGGLSEKTIEIYECHLGRLRNFMNGSDVAGAVRRYLAWQNEKGMSAYTRDQAYRSLKTFFRWAVKEGLIHENPVERIRRPKLTKEPPPKLEMAQAKKLLDAALETSLRDGALIALMLDTGLRRGEVARLRVEDLQDGMLRVWKGKGGKYREVPVGKLARELVRKNLDGRVDGPLFLSRDGQKMTGRAVYQMIRRLSKKMGVRLWPHLIRHTFASEYLRLGKDMKALQQLLGHSSVVTTEKYTEVDREDLKNRHRRLSLVDKLGGV